MSQMVLPQTPAPGGQPDTGGKKTPVGHEKSGDSQFDSISRAEQKRLDRKQADQRDQTQRRQEARNNPEDRKDARVDNTGRADGARGTRTDDSAAVRTSESDSEVSVDTQVPEGQPLEAGMPEELVIPTFADLQALLTPAAGASGGAAQSGAVIGQAPVIPGLAGIVGKMPGMPGEMTTPGQPGNTGFQLTEALTALTPESGRVQDSTTLLAAGRLQTLADSSAQQLVNARPPAEAAGLKGYATSVDVPVGHAEWGDKLVGKLTWLTANKLSVAEIHLTPPDMGPMEVRVKVQQEQANITIHSANPVVRDQLELHSHRLRDMLNEQGLSLEQFDVADSSRQQTEEQGGDGESDNPESRSGHDVAEASSDEPGAQSGDLDLTWKGEVDIFA
ncbi:flagellar hook-length control protein [Marinobacter lipolyticus SM19]|uniref:Flagellar hook-length control protein n=1 Tax=Marinobacter lipolyticus SM19 TaxID=1318628 RepID=R8B622_9GAMM|nr:flagellar hook-length control protein FliK [Marinobacter lipolyticus]EON94042.1 flagellar hook-length control protein [Marinobacter lipolyticus SM19]